MTAQLPPQFDKLTAPPEHYSYLLHRKQRMTQIILPVVLGTILLVGMIVLISISTFKSDGDVGRWAAISTMWLSTFMLTGGLLTLAILISLIYLMARALGALPYYTGIAQDYVFIAKGYILRGADMATKPVLALGGFVEQIKAFFERISNP